MEVLTVTAFSAEAREYEQASLLSLLVAMEKCMPDSTASLTALLRYWYIPPPRNMLVTEPLCLVLPMTVNLTLTLVSSMAASSAAYKTLLMMPPMCHFCWNPRP